LHTLVSPTGRKQRAASVTKGDQTMSEITSDTDTRATNRIVAHPEQDIHSRSAEHTAGTITRPLRDDRSHHRGGNPSRRPPVSEQQRRKLSEAQKAYVATDPRWAMHRQKLADAQTARRMNLTPEEFEMVLAMRSKGRTFSYIQEEIGVCHDVIRRELAERGYSTAPLPKRRAKRATGFWRSFD
jgi:hypothetical protein